jgi:hypothetical protein
MGLSANIVCLNPLIDYHNPESYEIFRQTYMVQTGSHKLQLFAAGMARSELLLWQDMVIS